MISGFVLVVIAGVAVGAYLSFGRRGRATGAGNWRRAAGEEGSGPGQPPAATVRAASPGIGSLAADLMRWVGAGLISVEQADAIAGYEQGAESGPAGAQRRVSLLAEALGYVGAVLALAGAAVGLDQSWENLPGWARLMIPAAATGLLLLGGFLLHRQEEPAFRRLMSVLWVLSVGAAAWTLAVLGVDVVELEPEPIALMAAGGCALLSGGLWWVRRHGLQQGALLASVLALVVSGLLNLQPNDPPLWWMASAVWAVGAGWAALGWSERMAPAWLAVAFGCLLAVVSPAIGLADYEWLLVPGLLTPAFLMAVSVPTRQTPLLALGTLGAFGYITWAVVHYFRDSLGVPLALVIVGAVFLVLAVVAGRLTQATRGGRVHPGAARSAG